MSIIGQETRLAVRPMTLRAARAHVKAFHRHAPNIQGGLFAVGCPSRSRSSQPLEHKVRWEVAA